MDKETLKFSAQENREFYNTLRKRVNQYFETNKISKYGNSDSILKTVFMFSLYLVPFVLMLTGVVVNPWLIVPMWILMGLGIAGIGMGVMHDANHGSFSSNKFVNRMLGFSLNVLGGNATLWKMQHNVLHHTFTNIDGHDEDIDGRRLLRFSPHQKRKFMHRFQHIYAWGFYSLITVNWVLISDYFRVFRYRRKGLIKNDSELVGQVAQVAAWKVFYYCYALVLPILLVPVAPWIIVVGFFSMHIIAGFILGIVFQAAHVMTSTEYPQPDENNLMANNWAVHQIETTVNFAPRNRVFSWLVGGLNFQIEHHLFAGISHVHYKALSKIVAATSAEYGIQYRTHRTFWAALREHGRMLWRLGNMDVLPASSMA
jgi:linoleoyl-CoA desaturase